MTCPLKRKLPMKSHVERQGHFRASTEAKRQGEAARKWQQGSATGKWWQRKVGAESGKMEVMVKNRCREVKE